MTDWISTKEAMNLLGVGSTTIKRWADEGRLPYYRTAGGHRRFSESAVRSLSRVDDETPGDVWTPEAARWLQWLMQRDLAFFAAEMRDLPKQHGDWFAAADFLGQVTALIGRSWADNECSIIEEHIASMKLTQAISAVAASLPGSERAPNCLVATLTGERHGLGALLAQLCLRSRGLGALILGTEVPIDQLSAHLQTSKIRLLALSASTWQTDAVTLSRHAELLGAICRTRDIELVLGGNGEWPDSIDFGYRCHSFTEFRSVLDSVGLGR